MVKIKDSKATPEKVNQQYMCKKKVAQVAQLRAAFECITA